MDTHVPGLLPRSLPPSLGRRWAGGRAVRMGGWDLRHAGDAAPVTVDSLQSKHAVYGGEVNCTLAPLMATGTGHTVYSQIYNFINRHIPG